MNQARKESIVSFAESCSQHLTQLNEKVVFAESCTGGMIASTMAGIAGISNYLCGSFVTYRPNAKQKWLGVKKSTIKKCSTESSECVQEMAKGALEKTPEAKWSLAIVGHLGPDAPTEKDGVVWICICRRTKKGKIKVKHISDNSLHAGARVARQYAATETALILLSRCLLDRSQKYEGERRLKTA